MKAEEKKKGDLGTLLMTLDPSLTAKYNGKALFPEKLARANAFLAEHPLPKSVTNRKQKN